MTVHEYCVLHDQPLEWCKDQEVCRRYTNKATESIRILPYLSGWERVLSPGKGVIGVFTRGEFMIILLGKHDIRLIGKGFSGEMRFYDAARKVMEIENGLA